MKSDSENKKSPMQPRPASTLALLRDTDAGTQVLMLQRTHKAVFMPGFYVFPGGAVDADDQRLAGRQTVHGHDAASANALLGVEEGGLGYLVAALRESFEEAGLLLARDGGGAWLGADHPALAARHAVAAGEVALSSVCGEHGLTLALDRVAYLDHWVTPPGPPRRFDTRFFAAEAPPGQVPDHDGQETIDHCWLTPAEALRDRREGRREFATPTIAVLRKLAEFQSVDAVLAYAREQRPGTFPTRPWPALKRGETVYVEPGRPAYDELVRLDPEGRGQARAALEPGEWVRLGEHLWRLTAESEGDGPGFNSYLLRRDDQVLLVDQGPGQGAHLERLVAACAGRRATVLTTRPGDQRAALAALRAATGATLVGLQADADQRPAPGRPFRFAGFELTVLPMPGQAPDHQALLWGDEGMLFAGTAVLERSLARGYLPAADNDAYVDALGELLEAPLNWIAPARGFLMGHPHKVIDHLMTQCLSRVGRPAAQA